MNSRLRRLSDMAIAGSVLVVLSPKLLLIARQIRKETGGSAFFTQERFGLNGGIIRVRKFRTMTDERDADGNLLPDSERKTEIGEKLRASGLDELLQFINVWRGDMSIVGPRPLKDEFAIPGFGERYRVKPGITSPAKIVEKEIGFASVLRDDQHDKEYVGARENLGHLAIAVIDIKVMFVTAKLMVQRRIDPPNPAEEQSPRIVRTAGRPSPAFSNSTLSGKTTAARPPGFSPR